MVDTCNCFHCLKCKSVTSVFFLSWLKTLWFEDFKIMWQKCYSQIPTTIIINAWPPLPPHHHHFPYHCHDHCLIILSILYILIQTRKVSNEGIVIPFILNHFRIPEVILNLGSNELDGILPSILICAEPGIKRMFPNQFIFCKDCHTIKDFSPFNLI